MKKLKLVLLLGIVIGIFSCKQDDDMEVSPNSNEVISSNGGETDEECDTTNASFFYGKMNGRDTCVVEDGVTISNGFGTSNSNLDGFVYSSFLSNEIIQLSSSNAEIRSFELSKGAVSVTSVTDFINFFQEGTFGFVDRAEGGYELSLYIDGQQNSFSYSTKGGAADEDNFIEVTKVSSQTGFSTIVTVEATVNAVLYDSEGNEGYRIKDGRLVLDFSL